MHGPDIRIERYRINRRCEARIGVRLDRARKQWRVASVFLSSKERPTRMHLRVGYPFAFSFRSANDAIRAARERATRDLWRVL